MTAFFAEPHASAYLTLGVLLVMFTLFVRKRLV